MSRKLEALDDRIRYKAEATIKEMKEDPILKSYGVTGIFISETKRELAVQMAYYSRGRMDVKDVKRMYSAAGLYRISDAEAKVKNTQTLNSKHIQGLAIDLYPIIDGTVNWNPDLKIWKRMGEIGTKNNLIWGGEWQDWKDYPHFQV